MGSELLLKIDNVGKKLSRFRECKARNGRMLFARWMTRVSGGQQMKERYENARSPVVGIFFGVTRFYERLLWMKNEPDEPPRMYRASNKKPIESNSMQIGGKKTSEPLTQIAKAELIIRIN